MLTWVSDQRWATKKKCRLGLRALRRPQKCNNAFSRCLLIDWVRKPIEKTIKIKKKTKKTTKQRREDPSHTIFFFWPTATKHIDLKIRKSSLSLKLSIICQCNWSIHQPNFIDKHIFGF
jgi:hypothetical protein